MLEHLDKAHPPSPLDAIRWLHLSDLHLGCRGRAACLHGHLHEASSRVVSEAGCSPRAYFQAASLFGLERYGTKDEERLIGFAWGRTTAGGEVRVWPLLRQVRGRGGETGSVG